MVYVWAAPASLLGLGVAVATVPFGTRLRIREGAIECYGKPIRAILERLPVPALALTLGHVIWGQVEAALDICRAHEHVHVRQYECWGPFFLPAYFLASLWLKVRGRDAYRENPFEIAAFQADRCRGNGGDGERV